MERKAACAVITRFGRELNDEGCKACARMVSNSYPQYADTESGVILLSGSELNDLENMLGLMEKDPCMFLVLSTEEGLRLLPSGPDNTKDYIPVFEEAIEEKTFTKTWNLLAAFVKEMEAART